MPYVYLIGWQKYRMYYYGSRYSKHADPSDLWVTYKTSSVYVAKFCEQNGDPDIIQIRRIFTDDYEIAKEKALLWESKILKKMKCVDREDFLNRWDNNMVPYNLSGPFPFESEDVQSKVSNTLKKRYGGRGSASVEIKDRIIKTNISKYGVYHTTHL